jgi:hypothetical protein
MVFVFGTGRCGTHTMWRVFEALPNTLSTHEGVGYVRSGPAGMIGTQVGMGCMPELNAYLYHYAGEEAFRRTFDPDPEMTRFMDASFAGRAKSIAWCEAQGIAYCDANPFAFNFIDYLHARYPDARFLHLVRDGYACVRRGRGAIPRIRTMYRPPDAVSWLLAKPVPFPSDPAQCAVARGYDRLQRISWFWNAVNANIAGRFERIAAQNRKVLKIEEVTEATLPGILDFCGLPREFDLASPATKHTSSRAPIESTTQNTRQHHPTAPPNSERSGLPVALTNGRPHCALRVGVQALRASTHLDPVQESPGLRETRARSPREVR